ncbi:MAG: porin family protein, partial [Chitinophagaceae bacterium]
MKTVFITATALLFSFAGFSQETAVTATRTTFGLRGGVNFQTINGKDASDNNLDNGITTGFHLGVNAEIPVGTGSYFQPGILYSMKGAEQKNTDIKTKLSYIEIPLNFVYKPVLGTGNMLLGFGPYVAFGVDGKIDNNGTDTDIEFVGDY